MLAVAGGLLIAGEGPPTRLALVAVVGVTALAGVALLSITWAESADNALVGASRWVLYASTFAILTVGDSGRRGRAGGGGSRDQRHRRGRRLPPRDHDRRGTAPRCFPEGRLDDPLGSINSQGLFMLLAVWPLIGVAQYARPVAAGLAAGGATGLMALAFLSQSRSVALAFAVGLVGAMLVPDRLRRVWVLLVVVGAVAAISSPLIDVYDQGRAGSPGLDDAIRSAAGWIVLAAAATAVVWGAVVALAERYGTPGLRRASAIALSALAVVGAGVLVVRADTLARYVRDQSRAFTSLQRNTSSTRLLAGGGNRYDYWRIALHEFADQPVAGIGADNFTRDYYIRRATTEDIRQPHSIAFQTLAELGLLGILALGTFLGAVAVGAVRHLRRRPLARADRALLVGTVAGLSSWLAHASVDWPHLIPGATGVALLAAAFLVTEPGARRGTGWSLAAPKRTGHRRSSAGQRRHRRGCSHRGPCPPLRCTTSTRARPSWVRIRFEAIHKSNDALAFNGDSVQALYLKSAAYARLGDYRRSRAALLEATRLEPHNFVPWALLGDLAVPARPARRGPQGLRARLAPEPAERRICGT